MINVNHSINQFMDKLFEKVEGKNKSKTGLLEDTTYLSHYNDIYKWEWEFSDITLVITVRNMSVSINILMDDKTIYYNIIENCEPKDITWIVVNELRKSLVVVNERIEDNLPKTKITQNQLNILLKEIECH